MNKKFVAVCMSVVMATGMLTACGDVEVSAPTDVEGVNVTVFDAEERSVEATAVYTGEIKTRNYAVVTSKVSAKVETIYAEVGDWVEAGEVLVKLDSSDYENQLTQAEAGYNQAVAGYNSAVTGSNNVAGANEQTKVQLEQALNAAEIAYTDAKNNYERQTKLYELGSISLVTYESAKSAYENAKNAYETAKKNYELVVDVITPGNTESAQNSVNSAEAAKNSAYVGVKAARENIANTTIVAPISGYVSAKSVVLGQFASAGMSLYTISNTDELEVEINVTESVIANISVGGKAKIAVGAVGGEEVEGEITVINPVKNQMGMFSVFVSVPNDEDLYKIGMFATVTLVTDDSVEEAVCVPSEAIMQDNDGYYVYVVEGNVAEKRQIKTLVSDGEFTAIEEGIAVGETIVLEGKEYLSEENNLVNITE